MSAHTENNNAVEINGISIPLKLIKSLRVSSKEVTLVMTLAEPVSEPEPMDFSRASVGSYYGSDGRCCCVSGLPLFGKTVVKIGKGKYLLPESVTLPDHIKKSVEENERGKQPAKVEAEANKPRITKADAEQAEYAITEMPMEGFSCNLTQEEIAKGEILCYFPNPPGSLERGGYFKLSSFEPCEELLAEIEAFKG